ncbi:TIGR00297 family protein [Archaeoglobales archaeon]|nr:MAG: TIGR00297 family protein [Archaeoglobales archaeon]
MLYASVISAIALLSPLLDIRIIVSLYCIMLIVFSALKDIKLRFYFVDENTSIFNTIVLSTILASLVILGVQKEAVFAAIFLVFAYEFRRSVLWNIGIFTALGFLFFYYFYTITKTDFEVGKIFFLALVGALASSLVESVESEVDKRFTVVLAASTTYTIFLIYSFNISILQLTIAFVLSLILSMAATKAGAADESGLMSATLIGTLVIVSTNIKFFVVLLTFYMVGSAITKYKYNIKVERGIAEPAGGARGYSNVFGNSLAALFFAMNYGVYRNEIFLLAFIASVATALGDTMASEVGKTAENVYLITNFEKVDAGVSGGISLIGEISAVLGCLIVILVTLVLGLIGLDWKILIILISSFLAIHIDSLLGATLENKGYLTNSSVNFLATLSSGVLCYLFFL